MKVPRSRENYGSNQSLGTDGDEQKGRKIYL